MRGCDQPGLSPVPRNLLIPHELEEWDGVGAGSLPGDDRLRKLAGQDHLTLQVYCLLRFPCRMGPHHDMLFSPLPLCTKGMPHDQNLLGVLQVRGSFGSTDGKVIFIYGKAESR